VYTPASTRGAGVYTPASTRGAGQHKGCTGVHAHCTWSTAPVPRLVRPSTEHTPASCTRRGPHARARARTNTHTPASCTRRKWTRGPPAPAASPTPGPRPRAAPPPPSAPTPARGATSAAAPRQQRHVESTRLRQVPRHVTEACHVKTQKLPRRATAKQGHGEARRHTRSQRVTATLNHGESRRVTAAHKLTASHGDTQGHGA
jgi:hypothetical protein